MSNDFDKTIKQQFEDIYKDIETQVRRIEKLETNVSSHEQQIGLLMERDNLASGRLRKLEARVSLPEYVLTTTTVPEPKTEYISVDWAASKSYWLMEGFDDMSKYLGVYASIEDALSEASKTGRWEVGIWEVSQNRPIHTWHYFYEKESEQWKVCYAVQDAYLCYGDRL